MLRSQQRRNAQSATAGWRCQSRCQNLKWCGAGGRRWNFHDRVRFLARFREAYRLEREETLAANRRAAGEPVSAGAFDRMTLAALDFDA